MKNVTVLYDLRDDDWTTECEDVIKGWFKDVTQPLLTIYFKDNDLIANCDVPHHSIVDLTYLLRQKNQIYTVEDFFDTINFGKMDNIIDGAIMDHLHNVYGPVYFTNPKWPDSILKECKTFHE